MNWRGTTTPSDRFFACLPYLIPLFDGLSFGRPFFEQFPTLQVVLLPLQPLLRIYSLPFASLIIFFVVFLLVVRNMNVPRFIRFNAMQAIMISIVVFLCHIVSRFILERIFGGGLILETLYNVVFLGVVAAVIYSVVQSIRGLYAEIPTLSEAVHMQVP